LCDLGQGVVRYGFPASKGWWPPVALSPDGRKAVLQQSHRVQRGGELLVEGGLVLWDVAGEQAVRTLPAEIPEGTTFTADGQRLLCSYPERLTLRDLSSGKEVWSVKHRCNVCAVSPDRKVALAVGGRVESAFRDVCVEL
jgi:hypothetical protein